MVAPARIGRIGCVENRRLLDLESASKNVAFTYSICQLDEAQRNVL